MIGVKVLPLIPTYLRRQVHWPDRGLGATHLAISVARPVLHLTDEFRQSVTPCVNMESLSDRFAVSNRSHRV